jgi:ArsR family transcriptional regulator
VADTHNDDSEALRYLRALGDPDRLKIVQLLRAGPKSVSDVCRELASPMANVSHHLHALKDAGVVSASKRGRNVIYRLDHVVETGDAGTHVLDFGCCRVEFVEHPGGAGGPAGAAAAVTPSAGDQALFMLNRILGQVPAPTSRAAASPTGTRRARRGGRSSAANRAQGSQRVEIVNPSFEHPATAFFDMSVDGWTKEGDPSGTGVFRNFPDDTPLPGSRQIRNADGAQLATIGARNAGGGGTAGGGAPGLFQSLPGVTYRAGASYVLSLGVGVSSVQPPVTAGDGVSPPPALRFALTCTDGAGRRREVVGRSVTPADVLAGQPPGTKVPDHLVYFSVAATLPASPASPACAGRDIGVLITTAGNTAAHAGHFILDNVSLTAADVPDGRPPKRPGRVAKRSAR